MAGGFCLPRTTAFTTSSPGHVPEPTFYLHSGADDRDRTGDLVLTKDVLCQLSYIGLRARPSPTLALRPTSRPILISHGLPDAAVSASNVGRSLERETGIEPATNSLEGCDSTTELLPPSRRPLRLSALRRASPLSHLTPAPSQACQPKLRRRTSGGGAKVGGEGRIRTFEAAGATDLQSVAFDRFATSPERPCTAPDLPATPPGSGPRPPRGSTDFPLPSAWNERGSARRAWVVTCSQSGAGEGI